MSGTTNENIIGMQEDKVKSFIISVNGEGITADVLIKYSEDLSKLWAVVDLIKAQCLINDEQKQIA